MNNFGLNCTNVYFFFFTVQLVNCLKYSSFDSCVINKPAVLLTLLIYAKNQVVFFSSYNLFSETKTNMQDEEIVNTVFYHFQTIFRLRYVWNTISS